ncbi:phosphomannomutase/phosphoglucomutase [Coxiella endosymbiont of Rhipicephalus microplus]|uniref:phosphomannomutase/phosphoglucomutase n=1 Tax=Coxiella endosymbiont of Rhipicephalus microplus TaxID=1656186 RepID=UPI000C80B7FE|nr:phosphomannomutase/phosphoglucomutase [Coxiella endosymbiont of Rhipicephalus microplus]
MNSEPKLLESTIPADLFRAYDIRGPVGLAGLNADIAYLIGLAIGSRTRELGQKTIVVGRDGRLSGSQLTAALVRGLCKTGLTVLNVGIVPTPLVYFSTNQLETNSGVMVTASHNPGHHNGFKIVLDGKTLTSQGITALRKRVQERDFVKSAVGKQINVVDIVQDYKNFILKQIQLKRRLKLVVDCGNGVAGKIAPDLYRKLGCEVIELFCEVDGRFPNHHPDPTMPENLSDLIDMVKKTASDIGLAFDGDGDRLGVVTNKGEIIWPDRQMMIFSMDLLSRLPGSDIIFDVKCSRHLPEIIKKHGGNPIMWCTGHSVLKAKLFEINALLAGEMSGHIFFKDEWFGFDDGIYVGARLLRIISQQDKSASEIFASLPNSINTPELKLPMAEEKKSIFMQKFIQKADFGDAKLITLDGLRVEFQNRWGLIRPSNTSPYLIFRFEADTEFELKRIQDIFKAELLNVDNTLRLPF